MSCIKDQFYGEADICHGDNKLVFERVTGPTLKEWRVKELERLDEVEAQTPDQVVLKQQMIETQTAICDVEDGILNLKEALGVMSLPPLAEVQLLVAINKARRAVKRLYKVQRKAPFFAKHEVSKHR